MPAALGFANRRILHQSQSHPAECALEEMLKAYLAHGDFTENKIDFIFRRSPPGVRKLASHLDASVCARRAQERIRAHGVRPLADASDVFGRDP
ncbi:hypothetical protein Tamer19_06880 [Cupriavidus sp. TA19]|nr:hypothetical protein Tamer19_06880 [Cupriavidus sp. TA19]